MIRFEHAFPCRLLLLAAFLGLFAGNALAQFELEARLEPDSSTVGGTVVYELNIRTSTQASIPNPKLPDFDPAWGFSTPMQTGSMVQSGTSINIGPGGSTISRSLSFRYAFNVSKEGTFNIGPATLTAGGQIFKSNPVTLKVVKMAAAINVPTQLQGLVAPPVVPADPALAQKLTGGIFVLPVITNPNPFNGEQVRVSFHLCIDPKIIGAAGLSGNLQLTDIKPPSMSDFIKEEIYQLPREAKFREQAIGERTYQVAPLVEVAISSTKTGKIEIEPFRLSVLFGRSRRGRGTFDDDFFAGNPLFSGMDQAFLGLGNVEVLAQSRPIEVNVKPLPTDGKPANFSGAVGDFKITSMLDREKAKANEDVLKLTVTVEGKGDASAIKPPVLGNLNGFTQLGDAKATAQGRKENDEYVTTKKIEYMLRPTQPGKLEIPPIAMATFNPKTQLFESLESNPVIVDVAPGTQPSTVMQAPVAVPATGVAAAGTGTTPPPADTDLRYIQTGPLSFAESGVLTGEGPLFFAALAVSPLLLLAGYLWGRRKEEGAAETRSRRQKRAAEIARKHLRQAEKQLNSADRSGFFAELARSLRTYFGDRFGEEASGITIEQIVSHLEAAGSSPDTSILAQRLLEQCDAAQYSRVQPEAEVAKQAYNDAIELLNRAERKA